MVPLFSLRFININCGVLAVEIVKYNNYKSLMDKTCAQSRMALRRLKCRECSEAKSEDVILTRCVKPLRVQQLNKSPVWAILKHFRMQDY